MVQMLPIGMLRWEDYACRTSLAASNVQRGECPRVARRKRYIVNQNCNKAEFKEIDCPKRLLSFCYNIHMDYN